MNPQIEWQQAQNFVLLVVSQIERIPAAAWVGIVGAFMVAWWANRGQTERLRLQLEAERDRLAEQLQHDSSRLGMELGDAASEKALERTLSMRREVYFAVASQLRRVDARLAQVPLTESAPSGLSDDLLLELGRVELVGDRQSRPLARAVAQAYGDAAVAVMRSRLPIEQAELELDDAERDYAQIASEITASGSRLENLRSQQASGIVNPAGLDELPALTQQLSELRQRRDAAHARRTQALAARDTAREEALRQVAAAQGEGRRLAAELSSAMRRELGFDERGSLHGDDGADMRPL